MNKDEALDLLSKKRELLNRGLSYGEKILFLHEPETPREKTLIRGKDQIRLFPDRVLMQGAKADLVKALTTDREVYDFLSSAAAKYGLGF